MKQKWGNQNGADKNLFSSGGFGFVVANQIITGLFLRKGLTKLVAPNL